MHQFTGVSNESSAEATSRTTFAPKVVGRSGLDYVLYRNRV